MRKILWRSSGATRGLNGRHQMMPRNGQKNQSVEPPSRSDSAFLSPPSTNQLMQLFRWLLALPLAGVAAAPVFLVAEFLSEAAGLQPRLAGWSLAAANFVASAVFVFVAAIVVPRYRRRLALGAATAIAFWAGVIVFWAVRQHVWPRAWFGLSLVLGAYTSALLITTWRRSVERRIPQASPSTATADTRAP
jgi:hypothetical protein